MIHLFLWFSFKKKYHFDDNTVVIMLPENNKQWNDLAIYYLDGYMKRKNVDHSFVFCADKQYLEECILNNKRENYHFSYCDKWKMQRLMDYYCLHQFSDKIVFFYLNYPHDNKSQYILDSTEVSIDELICHSFYRLRKVPEHV